MLKIDNQEEKVVAEKRRRVNRSIKQWVVLCSFGKKYSVNPLLIVIWLISKVNLDYYIFKTYTKNN